LFEQNYTRALINLGYGDTMARAAEVQDFLKVSYNAAQDTIHDQV
jgi:hypothetical protein